MPEPALSSRAFVCAWAAHSPGGGPQPTCAVTSDLPTALGENLMGRGRPASLCDPPQVVRAKERLEEELRIQAQEDRERQQTPGT